MMGKIKIFICIDSYLPGHKAGGPIISVANLVDNLGDQFQFYMLANNHDFSETVPYVGIPFNQWLGVGKGQVYYATKDRLSLWSIRKLILDLNPDIIYLNSTFAPLVIKVLILRYLRLLPQKPTILAPRGTFSPGALKLKSLKKSIFITLTSFLGFYKDIIWHASTEQEKAEIKARWQTGLIQITPPFIKIAPDMNDQSLVSNSITLPPKSPGNVKFVFVSRISRKKNLLLALELLRGVQGKIEFGIYGTIEDSVYWDKCKEIIETLPNNVTVHYYGEIAHEDVPLKLSQHHFFYLPTLGENFGHAIVEAMAVGLPIIMSDTTPWHNLSDERAGWDLPLANIEAWQQVLHACVEMGPEEYSQMTVNVKRYLSKRLSPNEIFEANINLFTYANDLKI